MDREAFALLEAEIGESYQVVQGIYERIKKRRLTFEGTPEGVNSMAYQIHNLYGAYEELFEAVASLFENRIEEVRYHADLLRRMKIKIKGIRPALLSESTYLLLDEMR